MLSILVAKAGDVAMSSSSGSQWGERRGNKLESLLSDARAAI